MRTRDAQSITADLITPKFYSRELEDARNADVSDTLERLDTEQDKNPRKLYQSPLLTSHTYVLSSHVPFRLSAAPTANYDNFQLRLVARQGDTSQGCATRLSQENVRPGELPNENLRRGSKVEGTETINGIRVVVSPHLFFALAIDV